MLAAFFTIKNTNVTIKNDGTNPMSQKIYHLLVIAKAMIKPLNSNDNLKLNTPKSRFSKRIIIANTKNKPNKSGIPKSEAK